MIPISAEELLARTTATYAKDLGPWPCRANRASEAGHPCARYLTHCRLDWAKRPPTTPERKRLFAIGEYNEIRAQRELEDAGLTIVDKAILMEDPSLELTGKLDFAIEIDRKRYPCEVKGLEHYTWEKINSVEDLIRGKRVWLRKYPGQLLLYLWLRAMPTGLFILKSKLTAEPKYLWVDWNNYIDYLDAIMERLKIVNEHVKAGTYPDPIDYDPVLCDKCDFLTLCAPERAMGEALDIETNERLAELLARREALKPASKEYEEVHEEVKSMMKERPKVACGDWLITGKWVEKKAFTVPAGKQWQMRVQRIVPAKETADASLL